MAWNLFIQRDNGDLVSEGSEVPAHLLQCMEGSENPACTYSVREVAERPNWTVQTWDRLTRAITNRPIPILVDRLDDIQARFLADPDFAAVWGSLNATRRTQLRTGIMRVLASLIGVRRFRSEDDTVEWD
jgi:hypothetical protein